jgi:hypothetical protein
MAEGFRDTAVVRRTVWSAVFAGVVIVLIAQLCLTLLGVGIGAAAFDPFRDGNPAAGLGIGSALWILVTALLSLFAGGWVAGRLAASTDRTESLLHGVLTWGLASLVSFFLISTAVGRVVSGGASVVGTALGMTGQGIAAAAPKIAETVGAAVGVDDLSLADVQREARKLLAETRRPELAPRNLERRATQLGREASQSAAEAAKRPGMAGEELEGLLERVLGRGRQVVQAADREALVNVIVARTEMSRDEASRTVARWEAQLADARQAVSRTAENAVEKTREVADAAATGVAKAALWTFAGLLLGLAAAALGGWLGSPTRPPFPGVTRFERAAA